MVHVVSVHRVEQLSWERITLVVGDIVIGESDDIVGRNAVGTKDGVSVADVRLMAIVLVSVGASDDDDVGVTADSCQGGDGKEEERGCKHVVGEQESSEQVNQVKRGVHGPGGVDS